MDGRTWTSLLSGLSCVWGVRGMEEEVLRRQRLRYLLSLLPFCTSTLPAGEVLLVATAPIRCLHPQLSLLLALVTLLSPLVFSGVWTVPVSYCNSLNSTVPSASLTLIASLPLPHLWR